MTEVPRRDIKKKFTKLRLLSKRPISGVQLSVKTQHLKHYFFKKKKDHQPLDIDSTE